MLYVFAMLCGSGASLPDLEKVAACELPGPTAFDLTPRSPVNVVQNDCVHHVVAGRVGGGGAGDRQL